MKRVTLISALAVAGLLAGGGTAYLTRPADTTGASGAPISAAAYSANPSASPSPSQSAGTMTARFNTWIDGAGGTMLENSLAILYKARADATAKNVAALEADGSGLVTTGDTSLAHPPPSHTAAWNAAFAAMVQAGTDLEARNLKAADTESVIVRADIFTFNSQISGAG
jgi:hypothetical protein